MPLSPVTVRARAVIPHGEGIVVARELRRGRPHTSLPGGRITDGETVIEAVVREVAEETGLEVEVGRLLYVAEVRAPVRRHDVNLIFFAAAIGSPGDEVEVIGLDHSGELRPPILARLRADRARGWQVGEAAWLGNLYDSELRL